MEAVRTPLARVPSHISLTWYEEPERPLPDLRAGQRWQLTARLRRPHGTANPHGFDSEVWLLERNLRAVGYVRAEPAPLLLDPMVSRPRYWIERIRQSARARILAVLRGEPAAGDPGGARHRRPAGDRARPVDRVHPHRASIT